MPPAAARWGVEPRACVARGGTVRAAAFGRAATYGELASDAAKIALAVEPAIKTPEHFEVIGFPFERLDTPAKAAGAAIEGLANCPYQADALKVWVNLKNTHAPVMWWRSVGSSQNAFAVESFIDEVANEAKRERRKHTTSSAVLLRADSRRRL